MQFWKPSLRVKLQFAEVHGFLFLFTVYLDAFECINVHNVDDVGDFRQTASQKWAMFHMCFYTYRVKLDTYPTKK